MTLAERYQTYELSELIHILEESHEYQPQAVETANQEIKRRGTTNEALLSAARQRLSAKIETYLNGFDVINDKLELPKSNVLNEEEVKLVFQTAFARVSKSRGLPPA